MGQLLQKLAPGRSEDKKEILPTIEECYGDYFQRYMTDEELYYAICLTVEKINEKFDYMQFRLPSEDTIRNIYMKHHRGMGRKLTKEEFQKMIREVIKDTGFTGIGAKESLMYIFGVPLTTLFLKQMLMPRAIPDDFFIPGITSITVLVLAGLNKI